MIFSKIRVVHAFGASLAIFLFLGCTQDGTGYKNRVVARVNNESLTAENFSERLASRLRVFNDLSAKDSAVIAQAKAAIIQDFIVQVVTKEWAQNHQIFVRKEQLDEEVKNILKQYPDEIAFRKALADSGLTYDRWEENLKFTLLERLVSVEIRKNMPPPKEDDLKSFYQANKNLFSQSPAVRLRQIVVDNENTAQRIQKELSSGKSLATLAKKFSITSEASNGGDVGWIEKGFLEAFDNAFKMNVGQRSPIVKSSFGFHIYEVIAKRPAKVLGFDEVKKKIEGQLTARAEQSIYSSWLENEVLKAHVHKDEEFIKSIKVQTRSIQ
jgi:peptidyl-prolyl cis-trans isomerase C